MTEQSSNLYLHHYPPSLFSEKIRVLLGYLGLRWHSVIIPPIMPRPLLMPLSGGYRKTPIFQDGANVYCDTDVIVRMLARRTGDETLYAHGFAADRVAEWADTQLFRVGVALNFAPAAVAAQMKAMSESDMQAFAADRAKLSEGASITSFSPEVAERFAVHYLQRLDGDVRQQGFLFGEAPCVADFSVYHCCWFLSQNPVVATILEPYSGVRDWMARMAAFGHGDVIDSSGEDALGAAKAAEPVVPALDNRVPDGLSLGDAVTVAPVDYGRIPVAGELAAMDANEIVILRSAEECGRVAVHFPAPGFEVLKVS